LGKILEGCEKAREEREKGDYLDIVALVIEATFAE
jgi:hypothetical protein